MEPMTKELLFEIMDKTPYGDIVLLRDKTSAALPLTVYVLFRYASEQNLPVLIDDILDTFPLTLKQLSVIGKIIDPSEALVIKTGGKEEAGNVIAKIPLEREISVYLKAYESKAGEVLQKGKFINIVLGMERLFAFIEKNSQFYTLINSIEGFFGNERRKAFYLVDEKVASQFRFNPIPELREISATVVTLDRKEGKWTLTFEKTPFRTLSGRVFEFNPRDVLHW